MKVCWLSALIGATITLWDEKRKELFLSDVVATDWDGKFKSISYSLLGISFIIVMLSSGLVLDIEMVYSFKANPLAGKLIKEEKKSYA